MQGKAVPATAPRHEYSLFRIPEQVRDRRSPRPFRAGLSGRTRPALRWWNGCAL